MEFMSDGIFNRLCKNCHDSNANIDLGLVEPHAVYYGGDLRGPERHAMLTGGGESVKGNW
jgi:hypothetical protein